MVGWPSYPGRGGSEALGPRNRILSPHISGGSPGRHFLKGGVPFVVSSTIAAKHHHREWCGAGVRGDRLARHFQELTGGGNTGRLTPADHGGQRWPGPAAGCGGAMGQRRFPWTAGKALWRTEMKRGWGGRVDQGEGFMHLGRRNSVLRPPRMAGDSDRQAPCCG